MSVLADPMNTVNMFGEPDWSSLGLVAAIVGCFLIANAILFEHPRRLVQRHFSMREPGRLRSIREYIYNRVQTTLGFTFLMGGFGLQLVGRYRPAPVAGGDPLSITWVGLLVIIAVALLLGGWWWSLGAFRRYVREHFTEHAPDLLGDPALARELGELFGIESREDDTVDAYVLRLSRALGVGGTQRTPSRPSEKTREEEVGQAVRALGR